MKKAFEQEILEKGIVDTKKYRYVVKDCGDHGEIQRLPIEYLGTTNAIDGWETVKEIW